MTRSGAPRSSAARVRAARGFRVRVGGLADTAEEIGLIDEDERSAVMTAFSACTPFGHSLWHGRRFVGWFEPGDDRIPAEWMLDPAGDPGAGMELTRQ